MLRILLATAAIAVTLSAPAYARITGNTLSPNGIMPNGTSPNGISNTTISSSTLVGVELPR